MHKTHNGQPIELFYSYCHEDEEFRDRMETALALLSRDGLLNEWHDRKILPGQDLNDEIKKHMDRSDILVFLFSDGFFASDACVEEWKYAKELADRGKSIIRIPIIVRVCPWLDFLGVDNVMTLPQDGIAISSHEDHDVAWSQVYQGIKAVVEDFRSSVMPKQDYLHSLTKTESVGNNREYINLTDIFVFPKMTKLENENEDEIRLVTIDNREDLLRMDRVVIHGQEKCGKTALAKYLYLTLIEEGRPVIMLNIPDSGQRVDEGYIQRNYEEQHSGDFESWSRRGDKTLIIDDYQPSPRMFRLLGQVRKTFERIVILMASDVFISYFRDEQRMADFDQLKIEPLNQAQQETLIRKRLARSDLAEPVTDTFVDHVENDVNGVIISNRIVPRYPFYVLSILQAYENYMPDNMVFTSSGHCYHALIVASLIRSGLSRSGGDLDSAFNFLEHLALKRFEVARDGELTEFSFDEFKREYAERFPIRASVVNRLSGEQYSVIDHGGGFRINYVYYFFLGKRLASDKARYANIISEMCEQSHISTNHLTLLFIIHHSADLTVIDHILQKTAESVIDTEVATLTPDQTRHFRNLVLELPDDIAATGPVREERRKERELKSEGDISDLDVEGEAEEIFRVLKNNKVIGQVLRNKYGQLEKTKIEDVVETIVDSALRLANIVLSEENAMSEIAEIIAETFDENDPDEIRRLVEFVLFGWTMMNLEQAVNAINVPEIRESVLAVVKRKNSPAYDLIGYFNRLYSASEISRRDRDELRRLLKKHNDVFIEKVLSLYTQQFLNTHASNPLIEQSIYDLLGVKRVPRLLRGL